MSPPLLQNPDFNTRFPKVLWNFINWHMDKTELREMQNTEF